MFGGVTITAGAQTQEIVSTTNGLARIRIERRGNQFTMYEGKPGEPLTARPPTFSATTPAAR
jgi:hypothetical protein